MLCAARGWLGGWVVVWCDVMWWCVCVVVDLLQRARAERSMIERRVGQCMECVVLAPFSKRVRSSTIPFKTNSNDFGVLELN